MTQIFDFNLAWWIVTIDIPALTGLLLLIWRVRQDNMNALHSLQSLLDKRSEQLKDALGCFKLEVAKSYASQTDMKELETRLFEHLLRIEAKLDKTALKAEALGAKT